MGFLDPDHPPGEIYRKMKEGLRKRPPTVGTVYRGCAFVSRSHIDHLRQLALKQGETGLYYEGQAAMTASTRDPSFAQKLIKENKNPRFCFYFDPGEDSGSILYVINQKSGYGIENVGRTPGMKEVVLPPTMYRVVRFEDHVSPNGQPPDRRWPEAEYVVYLEEN